ncbi:MAG TPA: hypothetical protein VGK60_09175 [Pedococcus sp.]
MDGLMWGLVVAPVFLVVAAVLANVRQRRASRALGRLQSASRPR